MYGIESKEPKKTVWKKKTNKQNPLLINKDAWESVASKISAFFNCIHLGKQKAQDLQIWSIRKPISNLVQHLKIRGIPRGKNYGVSNHQCYPNSSLNIKYKCTRESTGS